MSPMLGRKCERFKKQLTRSLLLGKTGIFFFPDESKHMLKSLEKIRIFVRVAWENTAYLCT